MVPCLTRFLWQALVGGEKKAGEPAEEFRLPVLGGEGRYRCGAQISLQASSVWNRAPGCRRVQFILQGDSPPPLSSSARLRGGENSRYPLLVKIETLCLLTLVAAAIPYGLSSWMIFFPLWPMRREEGLNKRLPTFATINFPNFNLRIYLGRGSLTQVKGKFGYIMNTLSVVCLVYYEWEAVSQIRHLLGFNNGNCILLILYRIWVHLETRDIFYIQTMDREWGVSSSWTSCKSLVASATGWQPASSPHLVLGTLFKP